MAEVRNAQSHKHEAQLARLAEFLELDEIEYDDPGIGENIKLVKNGRSIVLKIRGNKFDSTFLSVGEISDSASIPVLSGQVLPPEKIPFSQYMNDPDRFRAITNTHWARNEKWMKAEMETRHYAWIVVCGRDIVAGSGDMADFPNEKDLEAIGRHYDLIPFAYGRAPVSEEILIHGGLPLDPVSNHAAS